MPIMIVDSPDSNCDLLLLLGLPSNGIPGFLPYVVSIIGLVALLLSLCIIFITFTWLRTKKSKPGPKEDFKSAEGFVTEPKLEDNNIVYEEIDELQQNPQTIHISKNMAYCQFHNTKSMQMSTPKSNMEEINK